MKLSARNAVIAATILALAVTGACARTIDEASGEHEPAKAEPIGDTGLSRLTLEAKAAERLGIETMPVRREPGAKGSVVPYSAVIYDHDGASWVYTNPSRLVYVRHAITIDDIDGDDASLSRGPPVGAEVVTVGAAELLGIEFGVGH